MSALSYEELPVLEYREEDEDDHFLVAGENRISFNQFRWLPIWVNTLGVSEDGHLWRPIVTIISMLVWTIWQIVIQFYVGLTIHSQIGGTEITIQSIGNPVWVILSLYGLLSYAYLLWYMRYHKRHYKTLITKQLSVEPKIETEISNKILRNMILTLTVALLFLIASYIKSIIAMVHYSKYHEIPYKTMQSLPASIFILHSLVEPIMWFAGSISIFSCFLIMDLLGWVHAVDIRIYCSQLIYAARSTGQPDNRIPIDVLITQHQRLRTDIKKTQKLWTPVILGSLFLGTALLLSSVIMWRMNQVQYDDITPPLIVVLFLVVSSVYLLNIAYVNKFGGELCGQLYQSSALKSPHCSGDIIRQIDFFENYLKSTPMQFTVLGISITYQKLGGFLFVIFELSAAVLIKSFHNEV
ncbi:hypothetical protein PROFUN_00872 [Planoprotostelium fungivorum]|uniref:Uncharacterized protein n=1 Tax=Planoprotostelium fungivorum TaxID=1890364 RepID=A0A2P6P0A7_9EUKA|nr:hypothetical protein PROFUN_00872 [Planoprotostelium fungivorum]